MNRILQFPAVILAGGLSRRMGGGDKGMHELAGRSMVCHVLDRLKGTCAPIALNANGEASRFKGLGLPVLPDTIPGFPGPLAGVLTAMEWAASLGLLRVLTVAWDTPFLPADLAARLAAADADGPVIAASRQEDGQLRDHPTFGLWPVKLQGELRERLVSGERRMLDFVDDHRAARVIWDAGPADPFFNVNTPEDLARAEALSARVARSAVP